jgi:hypothetical protein
MPVDIEAINMIMAALGGRTPIKALSSCDGTEKIVQGHIFAAVTNPDC